MISGVLNKLVRREDLSRSEAEALAGSIMAGELSDAQVAGVLVALRTKGETVDEITGFAVAGEDKKFHWANAVIEGDAIVVSADGVSAPVAVRYAWANNPACNLYNSAKLPAVPFRSDDW